MIEVFIFTFNRPDLLEIQVDCLKKFLVNDFVINVIHDTRNGYLVEEFETNCDRIKQKYKGMKVLYYQHHSLDGLQSSEYHSDVLQWTYDTIVKALSEEKIVLFLDHDIFLTEDLNLIDEIRDYDIIGLLQKREHIQYIWPGLVAFKRKSFSDIDWKCGEVEGQKVDSGGGTYRILRDDSIKFKNTGADYPDTYKNLNLTDTEVTFGYNFELHYDGKFLHSRNACNWDTMYRIKDGGKTDILFYILNDILSIKNKKNFEIVISRYNEDISWASKYLEYCTIYNKGNPLEQKNTPLKNIGREGHTYIRHIVDHYHNLADHTVFLQGDPINPHSPNICKNLDALISNPIPNFIWLSERLVEGDYEYIREPYHKVCPNIKYAYEKVFGDMPRSEVFIFGSGAQFCVSREQIQKRPLSFYKNILDIFEYIPVEEYDEISVKLLGNNGTYNHNINPEFGLHLERFWGIIFNYGY